MSKGKLGRVLHILYVFLAVGSVVFMIAINLLHTDDSSTGELTPIVLKNGAYDIGNGSVSFSSYDEIKGSAEKVIITGSPKEKIPENTEIMLYIYRCKVELYVNDSLFYSNDDSSVIEWEMALSPNICENDKLTVIITPSAGMANGECAKILFENLSCGTERALFVKQISEATPKIILCCLTLSLGISILIISCALLFFDKAQETKAYFICSLLLIAGAACAFIDYNYITLIFSNAYIVSTVDFFLQIIIVELIFIYLKQYLRTELHVKIVDVFVAVWTVTALLYFLLKCLGVAEDTDFFFAGALVVPIAFMVVIILMVKEYFKYRDKKTKYILVSGVLLTISAGVEIVHYMVTNIYWIYVFQAGLFIFMIIQVYANIAYSVGCIKEARKASELENENLFQQMRNSKLETELIKNRTSVMLSQIKPHFIYNALSTIQVLCAKDPELAQKAIDRFSKYLRCNMKSIEHEGLIDFSEELIHIENYLYIEKLRFGDRLEISYNISVKDFSVPPLCVQTVVENAVKHGICKKKGGGSLNISSKRDKENYYIVISDTGAGFNPEDIQGDSHIGIRNTRNRLKNMCGGSLEIKSVIGEGTTATIKIPIKDGAENESNCT